MSNSVALPTDYQQYIHLSRYARYRDDLGRRETWEETVDRYMDFMKGHLHRKHGYNIPALTFNEVRSAILNLEVMPSMRALMTAGPALERSNIAGYNCTFTAIDHVRAFDEILYILMCGTGVGFSVERQEISRLPAVPEGLETCPETIVVADSKEGWAKAFRKLLSMLYSGWIPFVDYSRVRPAGARLKTFGGRASGPEPLRRLFEYTVKLFKHAQGRQLESIECHDLVCMIADIVVVGGVRRSALISLSNLSDLRMRDAKSGEWWSGYGHRRLANNSVAYSEKPEVGHFMSEWLALYNSKSGERGIFNRQAAQARCASIGRASDRNYGTNPCGEIILRSQGFCNLSEVVARSEDTLEDLRRKVRIAAIIGTWQSTLTDFPYLRPKWKANAEEERLLGVSITGIMDCPALTPANSNLERDLQTLRQDAKEVNALQADALGINASAAITCVKPSGTVSQLTDSGSGIHKRHSRYYIRRVRNDMNDPLSQFMLDVGIPGEVDKYSPSNVVFSFPQKAPEGADLEQYSAIEQLDFWLVYSRYWCDHNPSTTVYVREDEWPEVGGWVYRHFDEIGGLSFLPYDGGVYEQMPYEEIDEATYNDLMAAMPTDIDWQALVEVEDLTTGSQELACTGGACSI
jgi:ribonucleoside-diphosphate reductase alpha chain